MATIKAIEDRTVHQIQSGQVIVDLCSVVKELVENSLDAGATSIEVRFKNQGLDSIEVQDNGDGITPENYETVALKHHTSKLFSYHDLSTLMTFGFRGEALSSLCALSKFTITTCRAADAPKGTKLEFETSGKLKGTSVAAAQKGTTVSVENLFYNLPVRRQELQRKIKTEWNRVVSVLGQYACIQTGVKITVTSQAAKGKRNTLFSTKGNPTTRENIVNVFGAKTLTALLPMDLRLELEPTSGPSQRWSTQEDGNVKDIQIIGHISRPAHGEGRQTPDRQMFFVNSRPCGLPQVSKAFNEVYKSYNSTQSPFIFANIIMDTHMYDVNVSPDKRTILLHYQSRMLDELKVKLTELFEEQDYTVPISQFPAAKQPGYKQLTISRQNTVTSHAREESEAPQLEVSETLEQQSDDEEPVRGRRRSASGDNDASESRFPLPRHRTVSRESMNRDKEAVQLVSNWLDKKSKSRSEIQEHNSEAPPEVMGPPISKDKWKMIERLEKEPVRLYNVGPTQSTTTTTTTQSTDDGDIDSTAPPRVLSVAVHDFNKMGEAADRDATPDATNQRLRDPEAEDLGFVSAKSMMQPPLPLQNGAKVRKLTSVGDETAMHVDTIANDSGGQSAKRRRLIKTIPAPASTLPSFGSRLSQRFASGTQVSDLPSDEAAEDLVVPGNGIPMDLEEDPPGTREQELPFAHDLGEESPHEHDATPSPGGLSSEDPEQDISDQDDAQTVPGTVSYDDEENVDEEEKKAREDAKVQDMIKAAEEAAQTGRDNGKRTNSFLKGGHRRRDATWQLKQTMSINEDVIASQVLLSHKSLAKYNTKATTINEDISMGIDSPKAEERLSLTINKTDFATMKVVGQFNLGFILATRTASPNPSATSSAESELFIIDQHASDEKYNFERLQNTTTVQSQRLVQPKTLDLTAVEEEIVLSNIEALATNGFIVTIDESGDLPIGQRCKLISLPISHETTFSLKDLEELVSLLSEQPSHPTSSDFPTSQTNTAKPARSIPRPSKVRKMFAMRACRSSIMIGKTLDKRAMERVVRHMGEIDKPWNCPHGRPTMRHLCGLGRWDESGWLEGEWEGEGHHGSLRFKGHTSGENDEEENDYDIADADIGGSSVGLAGVDWRAYIDAKR